MSISLFETPDSCGGNISFNKALCKYTKKLVPVVFVSITEETRIRLLTLGDSYGTGLHPDQQMKH
jgi:hypothetical protein